MKKIQRKLDKKRRRENKTNYTKRLLLLRARNPRLVVRKTNRYLILQIIKSSLAQDSVEYSVNTKELLKYGWPREKEGSLKSIPAGYLAGLLLGKKIKESEKQIILDTGLIPSTAQSRIYAVVKGVSDAGINVPFSEEVIPSEEKIRGENTKVSGIFEKVKGAIEKIK